MSSVAALVWAVILNSQGVVPGAPPPLLPKKRIAISGFDIEATEVTVALPTPSGALANAGVDITAPDALGTGMLTMLTSAMVQTKKFIVLERKNLEDITAEQALQAQPTFDSTAAMQAGKLLGAQAIVRGALTEISYKKRVSDVGADGGKLGEIIVGQGDCIALVTVDLKLVDVTTGEILDAVTANGRVASKSRVLGLSGGDLMIGNSQFEKSPLARAVREAIKNGVEALVKGLEKIPWEARVASVSEDQGTVYLNFGKDVGLTPGTELEIFELGKPIVDPETRQVIGRENDRKVGKCKIQSTTAKVTTALITEGVGAVLVGNGVRIPEPPSIEQ